MRFDQLIEHDSIMLIQEIWAEEGLQVSDISRVHPKKNYLFDLTLSDGRRIKGRIKPFRPLYLDIYEKIEKRGADVPSLVKIATHKGLFFIFSEWLPGTPLPEVESHQSFDLLPEEVYFEWGRCMGKLNSEVIFKDEYVGMCDICWQNFIRREDGSVFCCDMSKIYRTAAPEIDILRWIVFNVSMPLKKKRAFIDGYIEARNYRTRFMEILDIFNQQLQEKFCVVT